MSTYLIVITDTHFGQVQHGRSGPLQANPDYSTSASAITQEPPYNQATEMDSVPADFLHSASGGVTGLRLLSQSNNRAAEGHGDLFGVRFTAFSASAVESSSAFAFSASCKSHSFTAFSMSANA